MARSTDNRYFDIHSHIIYGVDDGAQSLKESLRMLGMAYREGIFGIIATPHYGSRNPDYDYDKIRERQNILNKCLKDMDVKLRVFLGNEIYWNPGVVEELRDGRALTMAGTSYVLIEFSVEAELQEIEEAVRMLVSEGYRPIIAHVERYRALMWEMDTIQGLIEEGAYLQVNARSFLAGKRDKRFQWACRLLEDDRVHFIASDAHNTTGRKPVMREAVEVMEKIAGTERTDRIVRDNVVRLMKNQYI